jgi:hypothetical protein
MLSSDKKPTDNFDAEKLDTDVEVIELCVDEQAHVAGGALGPFKADSSHWDIALRGTSNGNSKGGSMTWDIASSAAEG